MEKALDTALVWFRRDLRVADHAALYHALRVGAPGLVRLRLRPGDPRPAAARRPAGRVHRRERSTRSPPTSPRSASAHGDAGRPPARPPRRRRRRDRRPGRRAARPGGLRQPRRRPVRAGPRRPRARRPGRPRRRPAHLEGPRDLRAQRGADRQRQAVQRLHALQGPPGWPSSTTSSSSPTRSSATPRAWPRRRPASTARAADAGPARLRQDQPRRAQGRTAAAPPPRRCSPTSSSASTTTTTARDYPGGQGPELPRRAPALRHDLDPPARRARRARASPRRGRRAARRRGLAVRADLARLLPAGAAPPAARRRRELQARVRPRPLRARPPRRRALRRLVRGPHRLSAGRRGDGADQPDRLDAQPAAHGRRRAS